MLCFERPPKPEDFDDFTRKAREAIERIIAAGKDPASTDFENRWRKYRPEFVAAQHGKCGYCESRITSTQYGDVEHYAPKAAIERIEVERWEIDDEDRSVTHRVVSHRERGYYWLAYAWDNYLLACQICNQRHKRALFPVFERRDDLPDFPSPDVPFEPLLLNPYDTQVEPSAHLAFDRDGLVSAREQSQRGWETIRVCRLDRIELSIDRRKLAQDTWRALGRLEQAYAQADEPELQAALGELAELGDERQAFAGMVRIMTEQAWSVPWADLMLLRDEAPS